MSEEAKSKTDLLLVTESFLVSACNDIVSGMIFVSIIGIGRAIDSPAMEWCGAIVAWVCILGIANSWRNKGRKKPQEAADYLRARYGVVAGGGPSAG